MRYVSKEGNVVEYEDTTERVDYTCFWCAFGFRKRNFECINFMETKHSMNDITANYIW